MLMNIVHARRRELKNHLFHHTYRRTNFSNSEKKKKKVVVFLEDKK